MMLYILMFSVIIIMLLAYITSSKELLSPTIILSSGYLISSFIAILNINDWGDVSYYTYFVILMAIVSFYIGELIGSEILIKTNIITKINKTPDKKVKFIITRKQVFIVSTFMLYIAYLYYRYTYNLSLIGGNPGGLLNMLSYARLVNVDNENFERIGFVLKYGHYFSRAYTYYIIYCIIHNHFTFYGKKTPIFQFIPVILYIVQAILTTGRTQIMYLVIYIFMLMVINLKIRSNWSNINDFKIIKRGIIAVLIILSSFWIIDISLRGSIYGNTRGIFSTFSKYISSSLIALDNFLNNPIRDDYFGKETLYNFYSLLNRVGLNFEVYSSPLEFTTFSGVSTNIYTALRRYIHDFGIVGMVIIQFTLGSVYSYSFKSIKYRKRIGKGLIFYCMMIYPVFFSFIEERFFTNILSLPTLTIVIFISLLWKFKKIQITETT